MRKLLLAALAAFLFGCLAALGVNLLGCKQQPFDMCVPTNQELVCPEHFRVACVCQGRFCNWGCKPSND